MNRTEKVLNNSNLKLKEKTNKNPFVAMSKTEKGITLIALVITIVILIILATISINAVLGENGLLKRTEKASQMYANAEASEEKNLSELDKYLANVIEGNSSSNQQKLQISYKIEDIDASGKVVKLSYTMLEIESILEAKIEEITGKKISDDIKKGWQDLANDNGITYEEILLEVILNNGEPMSVEDRIGGQEFAQSKGITYRDLVIQTIEEITPLLGVTSTAKNGAHNVEKIQWEFIATKNGIYTVKAISKDGEQGEIQVNIEGIREEKFSEIYRETSIYTDENEEEAKIPAGFAVGISEGINTVAGGLVITDAVDEDGYSIGNEYVWIPVAENEENFKRIDYHNMDEEYWVQHREPFNYTENGITYTGYETEEAEYNTMKTQVVKHHGFYIARYESGVNSATLRNGETEVQEVVSKRGMAPYNYVKWGESMNNIGTNGAVYLAQNIYTGKTQANSVTSTLIYGIQWDAMCKYIEDNDRYMQPKFNLDITGKVGEDNSKNIYDLAGNCCERTMEAYQNENRVARGGNFNQGQPIFFRMSSPNATNYSSKEMAFRHALYIK